MTSTKLVSGLNSGDAIMYKGKAFKVVHISDEGTLKRINLMSLSLPREAMFVLWHPQSVVTYSLLHSETYQIKRYISGSKFELVSKDQSRIYDLDEIGGACFKLLATGHTVYVVLNFCFEMCFVGNYYTLS